MRTAVASVRIGVDREYESPFQQTWPHLRLTAAGGHSCGISVPPSSAAVDDIGEVG
jgi:hypothetical protein